MSQNGYSNSHLIEHHTPYKQCTKQKHQRACPGLILRDRHNGPLHTAGNRAARSSCVARVVYHILMLPPIGPSPLALEPARGGEGSYAHVHGPFSDPEVVIDGLLESGLVIESL